jgi:hypothetical protein
MSTDSVQSQSSESVSSAQETVMTQPTESATPVNSQKAKLEDLIAKARMNLEAQKAKQLTSKPKPDAKDLKLGQTAAAKASKRDDKKAERDALKKEREAKRAERKAAREAKKAAKAAERAAKGSGDKLVAKAMAKLPTLDDGLAALVAQIVECTKAHSASIAAVVDHLKFAANVAGRAQAKAVEVEPGDAVRIVGGNPKFVGMVGIVERAAKLRCHVAVPGKDTTIYLFNSDVEVIDPDTLDEAPSKAAAKAELDEPKPALDANILDSEDETPAQELANLRKIRR